MITEQSHKELLMTASVYVRIRNYHLPYLREFQRLGWETHLFLRLRDSKNIRA